MRDGVLVARTLFGNENNVKLVRILNHTGSPYQLGQGDLVGAAEPVTVYQPPKTSPDSKGKGHALDKSREWKMPFPNISHQRREAMRVKAKDEQAHVQCLIDGLPKDLTPREHQMAVTFIHSRANSFSKADFDIGRTDIIKHRIDTGSNHPHYERLRRHPTSHSEEDRDKTAFVTRKGQWRFKVQSFGLCNAPSQFARTMELVLAGLTYEFCLIYLDDILVFRLRSKNTVSAWAQCLTAWISTR